MNSLMCVKNLLPCLFLHLLLVTCGAQVYDQYDIELFENKTSHSRGYNKYVYPKRKRNIQ